MGFTGEPEQGPETSLLLGSTATAANKIPEDKWHFAYIIYFTLGLGYLLPWNAFITAVDYFSYLYPEASVDRIFAVVYMLVGLVGLFIIIIYSHKSDAYVRINVGLALFVVSLLIVPVLDAVYIKGRVGLYSGFYITAGAVGLSGVADALVQGSIVGSAGELPERYMQAVIAGTAGSGSFSPFVIIPIFSLFGPIFHMGFRNFLYKDRDFNGIDLRKHVCIVCCMMPERGSVVMIPPVGHIYTASIFLGI